jgi:ATP-dependent helicase/nuclease subunit A
MQRLVAKGAAGAIEDPLFGEAGPMMRVGDRPQTLAETPPAAPAGSALPSWLTEPAPVEAAARVLSPSRLMAQAEPPVISPFDPHREARLRRGRLIHLLFQHLPALPEKARRKAAETFLDRQPDLTAAERAEMADAAMSVLEDSRFAVIFGPGGRPEAPILGRISMGGADIVNGRVDRLVVGETEVLLVDYKTDRPAPPAVTDVAETYIAQMAAYRAVLSQRWPGRRVRCLLVWTDGPKLMEIPGAMLDTALQALTA